MAELVDQWSAAGEKENVFGQPVKSGRNAIRKQEQLVWSMDREKTGALTATYTASPGGCF